MKLKTLKEIYWKRNERPKDIIKREAIKWRRAILEEKLKAKDPKYYNDKGKCYRECIGMIRLINSFFNFEEEEL